MIVRFSTVLHSHDAFPRNWEMEWDVLAKRLARHDEGDKDGTALICATFTGPPRGKETLAERWLVALDVEYRPEHNGLIPTNPEVMGQLLAVQRKAAVLWTTHSHTPERPRYRIVMPLSKPVKCLEIGRRTDNLIPAMAAAEMQLNGMIDTGKFGAESLFFLPRHAKGSTSFWSRIVEGGPINADNAVAVARIYDSGYRTEKAQLDQLRKTAEFPEELRALIEAYNDSHELTDLLAEYDYRQMGGGRWKSKYQSPSSQPATAIFADHTGWYSWSDSDKAQGLGHVNDDGIFGDAFSLFVHYQHGNNFRAAIAALRERYGAKET